MRRAKAAFAVGFFALLAVFAVQTLRPVFRVRPLDEKRLAARPPDIAAAILHGDGRLAGGINRWFDDRLGFRPALIRANHQIDYTVFGEADRVVIGRDGWLFLRSFVDEAVHQERGGAPWQRQMRQKFTEIAAYLGQRQIRLVIVRNPTKAGFYPQYLPGTAPRLPHPTQVEKLASFLGRQPGWIFVDAAEVLRGCGTGAAYYRTDIHETTPAADCVAAEIVQRIAAAEGKPAPFGRPIYRDEPGYSGGLAAFLSLWRNPTEIRATIDAVGDGGAPPGDASVDRNPPAPFEWVYRADPAAAAAKLPPALLYGNSFVDPFVAQEMPFQFAALYRVRSNSIPLTDVLPRIPDGTRYLIVQYLDAFATEFLSYRIPGD